MALNDYPDEAVHEDILLFRKLMAEGSSDKAVHFWYARDAVLADLNRYNFD